MISRLQDYVTLQAESHGDRSAVVMGDSRLTYGQLEGLSNQLAHLLQASGCRRGDRVCLLLPKSPMAIVSMLGALKADCVYVPVDVSSPAARTEMIVRAARPRAILMASAATRLVDDLWATVPLTGVLVGTIEEGAVLGENFRSTFSRADWEAFAGEAPATSTSSHDPAHLLFTSGSTGTPKGVVITHANVLHFVEWARAYFGMAAAERISNHSPLYFDLSTFDIYGTFSAGAELHLVAPELNLLPHKLAEFIRASELDQWFSVPSILTNLVNFGAVKDPDFPSLKRLLWCGEPMPTPTLMALMQRLPHVTFTNLYGPTEATIASSYFTVPGFPANEATPTPIGTACAGEELMVLDEALRPTAAGEVGEIYIAGVGLSPGYWDDAAKTRAAFLPHPHDPQARIYRTGDLGKRDENGLLYCLGRTDTQIKSRGYRIELGEIEVALNATGLLKESAVVGSKTSAFEGVSICCAYAAPGPLEPARLRQALAQRLPSYMLPSRWLAFDDLPKNANGKIDRAKLRSLFEEASDLP